MGSGNDDPQRIDGLTGSVGRGRLGTGSKSEREAVWLETDKGRFVLRKKEGPAFDDRSLEKYVGKHVKCDGFIVGYTLLAEQIEIVPLKKSPTAQN
jgi:hypothetical protein